MILTSLTTPFKGILSIPVHSSRSHKNMAMSLESYKQPGLYELSYVRRRKWLHNGHDSQHYLKLVIDY